MPIARSASHARGGTVTPLFPLGLHSSGRYLRSPDGRPFPIYGDTPWSIAVQLTHAQIDTYLNDRQARGVNAIMFNAIEHKYSSQSPADTNAQSGARPFTSAGNFSTPNEAYWVTVDYIVNAAKVRGMVVFMFVAYLGYQGGDQGWTSEINADTAGNLQTYGAFIANRYTQGNVVFPMGGDYAGDAALRARQWNIVTGMRSVRTTDLICAHPARGQDAYSLWGPGSDNLTGWNLGATYCAADGTDAYSLAATAYSRSGPIPFFQTEDGYEGEATVAQFRRAKYEAMLSGACGFFSGNNPLWGFGEPNASGGGGAAAALASSLNTTGAQQVGYLIALWRSYAWHKLVPNTGTGLVTLPNPLGSGTSRVCPALASDGTFALIYTPSVNVTVDMTAFTISSVRVRRYDVSAGTYTADGTYANTGTRSFTCSTEQVVVLDAP